MRLGACSTPHRAAARLFSDHSRLHLTSHTTQVTVIYGNSPAIQLLSGVSEEDELIHREVIKDFVDACEHNHAHLNASKTKEISLIFTRRHPTTQQQTLRVATETVPSHKFIQTIKVSSKTTVLLWTRRVKVSSIC